MPKKPSREKFKMNSLKSKDRASLEFDAISNHSDGVETYKIPHKGPYPIIPHPDLFNLIDELRMHLASDYGYTLAELMIKEEGFNATPEQKKFAEDFTAQMIQSITVTGIKIAGKERQKVIITGTYNGRAINSKTLHYENQEYGEDLERICDGLEDELFEYIFNDKKSQLEIAFPVGGIETIDASEEELKKAIGRKLADSVKREWTEDFIDEDTGDAVEISRKEKVLDVDHVITEEDIVTILDAGCLTVILQKES